MKHEKMIDEFIKKAFFKPWMTEQDFEDFLDLLKRNGFSKQVLNDNIEREIENGHTLEDQKTKMENLFLNTIK